MSLFVCDQCNVIANTAPDEYWNQEAEQIHQGIPGENRRYLCSQCRTGRWHGLFDRRQWDGKEPMYNRRNYEKGFA